jgi:hypothetical protein
MYNDTIATMETYNTTVLNALNSPNFNRYVVDIVEKMFQNMTIGLFSKQAFLGGDTPTNVTVVSSENVYIYSQMHLLLAYLSMGLTFIVVMLGLWTIWAGQAPYSNKFSTVMRTTAGSSLTVMVYKLDRTGADPLDKELGKLRIQPGEGATPDLLKHSEELQGNRMRDSEAEFMMEGSSMLEEERTVDGR